MDPHEKAFQLLEMIDATFEHKALDDFSELFPMFNDEVIAVLPRDVAVRSIMTHRHHKSRLEDAVSIYNGNGAT